MLYNKHVFLGLLAHKFFVRSIVYKICAPGLVVTGSGMHPRTLQALSCPADHIFLALFIFSNRTPREGERCSSRRLSRRPRRSTTHHLCASPSPHRFGCSVSSSIDGAREVLAFDASSPCFCRHRGDSRGVCCLICCLMDGDLGAGFLDVHGGFALDLGDFGLWLWIWLQQGRLLGCVAHRLCS